MEHLPSIISIVHPEFSSAAKRAAGPLKSIFVTVSVLCLLLLVLPNHGALIRRSSALSLALPGVALIFLASRPQRSLRIASLLMALVSFLAFVQACSSGASVLLLAAASLGFGSFLSLAWMAIATRKPRSSAFAAFAAAALLLTFSAGVGLFFHLTVVLAPATYDAALYRLDQQLGFQSSFLLGQLFAALPPLQWLAHGAYLLVPSAIAAMYAAQLRKGTAVLGNIIVPFTAAAVLGWMVYLIYPAAGPIYAFGTLFPFHPPAIPGFHLASLAVPDAARNCMPSLHTAWALLILWNSRVYERPIRIAAAVFFTLTILATLGLGEHYAIDLVVAVPFAVAAQAACMTAVPLRNSARLGALVTGAGLATAWIVALKSGAQTLISWPTVYSGVVCWIIVATTVIASFLLESRLARVALGAPALSDRHRFEPVIDAAPRIQTSRSPLNS